MGFSYSRLYFAIARAIIGSLSLLAVYFAEVNLLYVAVAYLLTAIVVLPLPLLFCLNKLNLQTSSYAKSLFYSIASGSAMILAILLRQAKIDTSIHVNFALLAVFGAQTCSGILIFLDKGLVREMRSLIKGARR